MGATLSDGVDVRGQSGPLIAGFARMGAVEGDAYHTAPAGRRELEGVEQVVEDGGDAHQIGPQRGGAVAAAR